MLGAPGGVPGPPSIDLELDKYFADADAALLAAKLQAEAKLDAFELESDGFYDNFAFDEFSDPPYEPPSLDSQDQEDNWENSKSGTDSTVDAQLATFASPDDTTEDSFKRSDRVFNFLFNTTDDLIANLPNRSFDFYSYDNSIFQTVQQNLITAGDLLLWADIT